MKTKRKLLVIEDNELNREMLTVILEDSYDVLTAENGAIGYDLLKSRGNEISLILLDIQMPIMNGYEFLEKVYGEGEFVDIPIIVTTSSGSDEEQIRCLEMGASDFVSKPYKPEVVKKRVNGLIRLRETTLMLHKVEYDEITKVYNREAFSYYASKQIESKNSGEYDMVCIEIESFMNLQGKYGVENCNVAFGNLAKLLKESVPKNSILGRIDNGQIAILIPHMPYEEHVRIATINREYVFSNDIPAIKTNVGVYLGIDKNLSFASILENAVAPIDEIRNQYGKFIALYDDETKKRQAYNSLLMSSAEQGIRGRQFKVWYQPKHSAELDKTAGAEALIRWIHPELGFISPGAFIPVFESNGFIVQIDLYVIDTVCADLRKRLDEGKKVVPVSANISQVDFDLPNLTDILEGIVDKYNIPHELIHFEITESANTRDKEKKAIAVSKLCEKGFEIELDDFGSGYSNLTTLGELPISVIKLDMSLIRNMFEAGYSSILRGVLYTAHSLGKKIVCEGVETLEQVNALKDMCKGRIDLKYQGYYYSKPLPIDQFETYLENH